MLTLEMYLLENRIEIYFVRALVNFKAARITPMHIILAISPPSVKSSQSNL
jgi:hypothetical protein